LECPENNVWGGKSQDLLDFWPVFGALTNLHFGTEGNHPFSSRSFAFGKIPDSLSGQFPSVPDHFKSKLLN